MEFLSTQETQLVSGGAGLTPDNIDAQYYTDYYVSYDPFWDIYCVDMVEYYDVYDFYFIDYYYYPSYDVIYYI